ncbi:MAG: 5'-nucleotidase C-terminal domain-containing protein [Flavonifractor plautii]
MVGEHPAPLSDYEPDDRLNKALSAAQSAASDRMQAAVGTLSGDWSEEGSPLYVQSATVDLVAEAMLWAADADAALLSPAALGGASAASRFSGEDDTAALSLRDCAALAPGDSPVVLVELTGAELRQWLDRSAEAYQAEPDGSISGGEGADVLYGMDYALYLGASEGQRVDGLAFEGALVDDGQTFRVAVSADRLSAPDFPACTPSGPPPVTAALPPRAASPQSWPGISPSRPTCWACFPTAGSTWSLYTGSVNGPLNRLEFVTMLYEMAGKPKPGASAAFIDVSNSDAAVWAAETGVVSGNGTGKFLPTQTVTREQAAVMLYNYAKFLGLKTPSSGPSATALLDCGEIAVWARPAVEFCIRTGALSAAGLRGDLFLPRGTLTRGEANRCLAAFADYIEAN